MNNEKIKKHAADIRDKLTLDTKNLLDITGIKAGGWSFAKYVGQGLLVSALAFLLGTSKMVFTTYPAGIALLCAASRNAGFIYIGMIAAAAANTGGLALPMIAVYSLAFAARVWIAHKIADNGKKVKVCEEPLMVRIALSMIIALILGICSLIVNGLSFYGLVGTLFAVTAAPCFTFILNGALGQNQKENVPFLYKESGWVLLAFLFVYSLTGIKLLGFSLALSACAFVVLWTAKEKDLLRASVTGLVCGLACGAVYSPMFAIMGLVSGAARKRFDRVGMTAGLFCATAYALWVNGLSSLTDSIPNLICGTIIFIPIYKLVRGNTVVSDNSVALQEDLNQTQTFESAERDAKVLSNALSELSELLYALSEKLKRPTSGDVEQICRDICSRHCGTCSKCSSCYGNKASVTSDIFTKLASAGVKNGLVSKSDVPEYFKVHCDKLDSIISGINSEITELTRLLINGDRSETFASCYGVISKLVQEGINKRREELTTDPVAGKRAAQIAHELKINFESIAVYGKRNKKVVATGIEASKIRAAANTLATSFGESCRCRLSSPKFSVDDKYSTMTMESVPAFTVEAACAFLPKQGEDVCGDTVQTFTSDEGYYYSILSDGTGSGREAALTSRICCTFADKLTQCGGSLPIVIETINNFILNQNYECGATVDLMRLDLYSGEACFVKSGAVPSFVLRNGNLFKISANSMPVGLTKEINTEQITLPLSDGDLIIMVSDGVAADLSGSMWLAKLISEYKDNPVTDFVNNIITCAEKENSASDDISAIVLKISCLSKKTDNAMAKTAK